VHAEDVRRTSHEHLAVSQCYGIDLCVMCHTSSKCLDERAKPLKRARKPLVQPSIATSLMSFCLYRKQALWTAAPAASSHPVFHWKHSAPEARKTHASHFPGARFGLRLPPPAARCEETNPSGPVGSPCIPPPRTLPESSVLKPSLSFNTNEASVCATLNLHRPGVLVDFATQLSIHDQKADDVLHFGSRDV
jgi:hypothetical protein